MCAARGPDSHTLWGARSPRSQCLRAPAQAPQHSECVTGVALDIRDCPATAHLSLSVPPPRHPVHSRPLFVLCEEGKLSAWALTGDPQPTSSRRGSALRTAQGRLGQALGGAHGKGRCSPCPQPHGRSPPGRLLEKAEAPLVCRSGRNFWQESSPHRRGGTGVPFPPGALGPAIPVKAGGTVCVLRWHRDAGSAGATPRRSFLRPPSWWPFAAPLGLPRGGSTPGWPPPEPACPCPEPLAGLGRSASSGAGGGQC